MGIVGGMQLPHVPVMPGVSMYRAGAEFPPPIAAIFEHMPEYVGQDADLMIELRDRFLAFEPDAIVLFDSDHVNTFFLNHVPSIAVGVDDQTSGPNDHPFFHPDHPHIPVDRALGDRLHRGLIEREFDVSRVQRFTLDHSATVPLHFMTPDMDVPVVPVWINGLGGVPIRAQRARALGAAVRQIVDRECADRRVVAMSSGAISVEIGTPRVFPGEVFGVPDPAWVTRVAELVEAGEYDRLVTEATPDQLRYAGNAAPELLDLIALIGAVGTPGAAPERFQLRQQAGHLFAVWRA